jgi:hypothetical protein
VRPRKGSAAICSRCHQPAPEYDQLSERRFEFIPFWGFLVFLLYSMRRVDCRGCEAVVVEEVPWGDGKHTLSNAYMLFLARCARRISWKETAEAFHTSWEKVFGAVEHVVTFGLGHRTLGRIDAIGVDEIQYAKGHKYLTLVYQIDLGVTRLLWVGKERTIESFQGFFTMIGDEVASMIVFVCSDMWEPYLKVIREKCSEALHILDRFHIVAKMNKALDEVRAGESCRMAMEGRTPVLDGYGATMTTLCIVFSDSLDRDVIDKTGITGIFDFHFDVDLPTEVSREATTATPSLSETDDDSGDLSDVWRSLLFNAFQSAIPKVGLKLQPARARGEFLVIDHVERPSEN